MKKNLQTEFSPRQYMLSKDFELYYYNDKAPHKVAPHTHSYYEFYFFLEGDVSLKVGEDTYPLHFGDIFLIPPGVSHHLVIHDSGIPYRRFIFWISQEYCQYLLSQSTDYGYLFQYVELQKSYIFHNSKIEFHTVESRIIRILEEMNTSHFGKKTQISLCVNDLLLYLNRMFYERNHPHSRIEQASLYQNLVAYIEDHVDENLSLEKLAEAFFVSKYHISHVFKENLGMSIHQYITKKRLALCREAILGNRSITESYLTYGFGDYSSFYRAFKKEYGISPKDFRDMNTIKLN